MSDTPLQNCIKAAHRAGLQNAEQLSEQSVILRFPSLCAWYRQACRERDEMERQRNELLQALEYLLESTERPPDPNCSCHICPPCSDCVDHSGLREAVAIAEEALAQAAGGEA